MKFQFLLALAACLALHAEDVTPHIGYIEVYGVGKGPAKKIVSALGVSPGGVLPASRNDLQARINKIPGVLNSQIQAVCCDGNQMILYVGVEDKSTPHVDFHPAPDGTVVLPQDLVDAYHAFLDAVSLSGNADEDLTSGYSLVADASCRERQQSLLTMAARDPAILAQVVRSSADPEQRAIAAYVLQYSPRGPRTTPAMINALQYALQDPDSDVRQNAMRALKAVAVGGRLHPEQNIRIEPTWYVELLNSLVWSDRRNASLALVDLTEKQNSDSLDLIRNRALTSVVQMARWRDLQYALPGFILAGRLAGLTDKQIEDAWVNGNRETVLQKALKSGKNHPKSTALASSLH